MQITGEMLIGGEAVRGTAGTLRAFDPARNLEIEPAFGAGDAGDVDRACRLAQGAFDAFRQAPLEQRAKLLDAIGDKIMALGDALIERAQIESALPKARLEGERARTVGQLKLFAALVRDGRWLGATLDSAMPERKPLARSDLRLQKIPLGPVAVFGASNFPLAFSVAGGDTASALAAGCPVVVKAHPAHLGTSELVGRAIREAVAESGLPAGIFSLVLGAGNAIGEALVAHPAIKAVGFTGSRGGGVALMNIAARRREPIPVYAEMSSINPFFVLPGALAARGEAIANGFVESLTLGVGQFCTNPGLVVVLEGPHLQSFVDAAAKALEKKGAQTMLTAGIASAYRDGIARRAGIDGIKRLGEGATTDAQNAALPSLFAATQSQFLANAPLEDEIFGPTSLIVTCRDIAEMMELAERLEGQLTASLHLERDDHDLARQLLPTLERKAGRILANGFPTGVEVCHAMVHGGPYPATSDPRSTSVGTLAIERFLRPVCYQDLPAALLPQSVQDENPLGLWRLRDGAFERR
ncbi:aldehyde dehydrogenase (NADP(+)) [Trinickia caryophylli]|uniref:NADP-dependent aldehyde dehydrogenase n=1 Tax=Trinickia caryophylli TaxID=28094 RepID=A0A1X7FMR4_TRICW|nr:aldehyde dehydrogenase (NADP(+)) [Trinickia caryophylli]PMS13854.1 aldehyde dehydrogenase (NADP(+)) [Trinickia caryophylli]TRX14348.1 aldehyde dehydrogenase (NADP(+)) [Trinickia caryophylli]WQE14183.1 aldehyde dehydrogenase (NADP(+)) [Trinickia caryophylli]SMF55273.1 NADP-dependent aldehyde dehydrogenase [Trinickia caryophylli]GLU33314.1 fatty aldehyde dehydrogenase [Trinickia caryophylli]